jgi:hypothetical protein
MHHHIQAIAGELVEKTGMDWIFMVIAFLNLNKVRRFGNSRQKAA